MDVRSFQDNFFFPPMATENKDPAGTPMVEGNEATIFQ